MCNLYKMFERRRRPFKNKTLPLMSCLMGVNDFLEEKLTGGQEKENVGDNNPI